MSIPFNKPCLAGREVEYAQRALSSDKLAGDGALTHECQALLQEALQAQLVLLTMSCTAALELAALLLDISDGDEVIMPSFTFSSTANAFCLRGAKPVFADIRADTLNLDETLLEQLIGPRTRAIVPVHYAGVACEMDAINDIARRHDIAVVEDAAHAICATYRGRSLGTLGDLGCFSFHDTKTLISGEGGAIAINRPSFAKRAEILREKGTNRSSFLRGEIDKYTWVDIGSSLLPSEVTAAILLAQLECRQQIFAARKLIFDRYAEGLSPLADRGLLRLPEIPPGCEITYHMFYILTQTADTRDSLLNHLRGNGIGASFHYVPLHSAPMGLRLCGPGKPLPVTESSAARIIRLPFYNSLDAGAQQRVIDAVFRFFSVSRAN